MKNQSKFHVLTLVGVFAFLALSLSSCFYSGYAYRDRYYSRPYYGYRPYVRPQVRVYTAPPRRYYYDNHRNYSRSYGNQSRGYRGDNNRSSRSHGRR